ncbi:MAG: preprotein translocase subunit SecG [Candidatus Eisenbacteria bacterium]
MTAFLTVIHIVNCVLLVVVVLLQSSKGGGLAGAFGGGAATQAVFGGRGAGSFLSRLTTGLAVLFMLTSLTLTILSRQQVTQSDSALRRALEQEGRATAPARGLPEAGLPEAGIPEEGAPQPQVEGALPAAGGGEQTAPPSEGEPAPQTP